ncbi:hypothetical protein MSHOH_1391 [Methanosarcina horonobensis HB-1 = JCM 15518]|uniref:Uncharacterized protein n=1 Tax=Methanosarcina horonobensis HB-1 = JCM 15518 TaxID=1434110 RepID=A0A0E3S8Q7_9EURY|nr:hypothetical protein MSHOH_1391 [Methanosarcina horonobensis HB-1 = JCM 15518]
MNLPIAIKENWVSFAKYMFLKTQLNILYVMLFLANILIWIIDCSEWKPREGSKRKISRRDRFTGNEKRIGR